MKIAYLILAHHRPDQLRRLVSRLYSNEADCWIHLDSASVTAHFDQVFALPNVNRVSARVRAAWGSFGSVQAMLNSLEAALNSGICYSHFQFLSGADYPLLSSENFVRHLTQNPERIFIGHRPLEETESNLVRFYGYHFPTLSNPVRRWLEGACRRGLPRRRFFPGMTVRKGSQWMCLSRSAARYVLEITNARPQWKRYFRFVHVPDEMYFQTILFNSPFLAQMCNQIHHYIDWTAGGKSPGVIGIKHLDEMTASGLFFARKFDPAEDSEVLDRLDRLR